MAEEENNMEVDEQDKVFETREYQTILLEKAIKENCILFLPTGAGKTYIAQNLIKHFGHELEKPFSQGGKRSFFLCTTQALLYQQGKVLQRHLPYRTVYFTGADGVDYWSNETWLEVLEKNQVIALTAQILLNLLSANRIQFRQISVIVFDECHHAGQGHPMKVIADLYKNQYERGLCSTRILGLTATLINADYKVSKTTKQLINSPNILRDSMEKAFALEKTFCGKISSSSSPEVAKFSTNPSEEIKIYDNTATNSYVIEKIENDLRSLFPMMEPDALKWFTTLIDTSSKEPEVTESGMIIPIFKKPSIISDLKRMYDELFFQLKEHGLNAAHLTALMMMLAVLREQHCASTMPVALFLEPLLTAFQLSRRKMAPYLETYDKSERFLRYNSPKVNCLLDILRNYDPDTRTLVFCQKRATVKVIFHILKNLSKYSKGFENIKPDFLVGQGAHLIQNTHLADFNKKNDKLVVSSFNRGLTNLLVATDVIEEGIDIQSCNLVIKFDPPMHTRSYVQSKGRARAMGSQFKLIVNKREEEKFLAQYNGFKKIEEALKKISQETKLNLDHFRVRDEKTKFYYVDGLESASVSDVGAPTLLYQYCQTLQHDHFSVVAPSIFTAGLTRVVVRMPVSCPIYEDTVSESIGEGPEKLKKAFQDACLKVCVKLLKHGELTEDLRPINHLLNSTDIEWYPHYKRIQNTELPVKLYGTSKHKEFYKIQKPVFLKGAPQPNETCYMHIIKFKTAFDRSKVDTQRKKIYENYVNSDFDFAIITKSKIPPVCSFPLYDRLGDLSVSFQINQPIILNADQLMDLHQFHCFAFRQILPKCVKSFFVSNNGEQDEFNAYFIAPVLVTANRYEINWMLISELRDHAIINESQPNVNDRKNLKLQIRNYKDYVVFPWHRRNGQREPYLVTGISRRTSSNQFPDYNQSYEEYFLSKYDITLCHKGQFLLEVKPVTNAINFIPPRSTKDRRKYKTADIEEEEEELLDFEEELLPELCNLLNIPAVYYTKFLYLPSVLHRFSTLLACDQLRCKIGKKTGLVSVENLISSDSFKPLITATENQLAGKKQTYTPMDLKSKGRELTIETIKRIQTIDAYEIELCEKRMANLDLNSFADPDSYIEEDVDDLQDRFSEMYLEREIEDITLFDINVTERRYRRIEQPLLIYEKQNAEALTKCEYKEYDLDFVASPTIHVLDVEFDSKTCIGPGQRDIFEAITAHSCNDIVNYERLETLGDSFLKFSSTLALFTSLKSFDEGRLTLTKNSMVGNKNLFLAACANFDIPSYIKIHSFGPLTDWTPPRFSIPQKVKEVFDLVDFPLSMLFNINIPEEDLLNGDLSERTRVDIINNLMSTIDDDDMNDEFQSGPVASSSYNFLNKVNLNDKVIADVVEALTGCYLKFCGIEGAMKFLQVLDILPESKVNIDKLLNEPHPSALRCANAVSPSEYIKNSEEIENRIQYKFNDKSFLLEALTHPTYNNNRSTGSYQRLEFLGDAVIDFLVTTYLYENYSDLKPGDITDIRSALVNNVTFASYACRIGLHKYILFDSVVLNEYISRFVEHQEARDHEISDEIFYLLTEDDVGTAGIRERVAEKVDVPKALGDVFESIIGAIYIDSGKDLKRVWYYLYNFMKKEIDKWVVNPPKNAIRSVHDLNCYPEFSKVTQVAGRIVVTLNVISPKTGERKTFFGAGKNKRNAKLAAAKIALQHII